MSRRLLLEFLAVFLSFLGLVAVILEPYLHLPTPQTYRPITALRIYSFHITPSAIVASA